jgi:U3 small nucleolar RNA-associated protein 11
MLSANKAEAGKHGRGDTQVNRLSHDAVKLLKSQDAGYLRVVAGRGRKEVEMLEESVGMEGVEGRAKKVVFVDGDENLTDSPVKRRKIEMSPAESLARHESKPYSGTENLEPSGDTGADDFGSSLVKSTSPKSKKALVAQRDALRDLRAARKRRKRLAEMRVAKLEALKKRQKDIMAAADDLESQRAKMARTVGGVNNDGVRWRIRERKR